MLLVVRGRNQLAKTIHFSFGYSDEGGVSKQYTLEDPTNLEDNMYKVVEGFADELCDHYALFRTVSISLTQFIDEKDRQLNLFIDEYERKRNEKLAKTIDALHRKFGRGIVSRAVSYTDAGTKHGRLGLMAGHKCKVSLLNSVEIVELRMSNSSSIPKNHCLNITNGATKIDFVAPLVKFHILTNGYQNH